MKATETLNIQEKKTLFRWIPLFIIITMMILIYFSHWYEYLTFSSLSKYHASLNIWTQQHYFSTVLFFIFIYVAAVATSIPGAATILTITAGFLFGLFAGTCYIILAATLGASILFASLQTAIGSYLTKKGNSWVKHMKAGFKKNAFNYLLFLRLVPLFPFWAINIAAALLGVKFLKFFLATFIGIIPGAFIYVSIGCGLKSIFAKNETPNFAMIFEPKILIPILSLAVLSIAPIIIMKLVGRKNAAKL
jgi:uncharacterized membrane protein YdjX (TVP38/TMEM64 family)